MNYVAEVVQRNEKGEPNNRSVSNKRGTVTRVCNTTPLVMILDSETGPAPRVTRVKGAASVHSPFTGAGAGAEAGAGAGGGLASSGPGRCYRS